MHEKLRRIRDRAELQAQNKCWWGANPMSYDWDRTIPSPEGTPEFFEEVDRRFLGSSPFYRGTHPLSAQSPRADFKTFRGACIGSLEHLLRAKRAKALWINGWQVQAHWRAAFQASRLGAPVWLRGESNDLSPRPRARTVARRIALRLLFQRVSRFLYIGCANRREYERFGVRPEQLVPAPYCVDNSRFRVSADCLGRMLSDTAFRDRCAGASLHHYQLRHTPEIAHNRCLALFRR
jgi:hypothetical protein